MTGLIITVPHWEQKTLKIAKFILKILTFLRLVLGDFLLLIHLLGAKRGQKKVMSGQNEVDIANA